MLLTTGILAVQIGNKSWKQSGTLLVGFSGSWLAGTLFWGWLRMHPVLHLPVEAIALPLAIGGLNSRWKLSCSFYLASLLGTAITDITMALTGVMSFWPEVVNATSNEAPPLLNEAAKLVLQPTSLLILVSAAGAGDLVGKAVLDASSKAFRVSRGLESCGCCPLHHPFDRCFISFTLPISSKSERSDLKRTANA